MSHISADCDKRPWALGPHSCDLVNKSLICEDPSLRAEERLRAVKHLVIEVSGKRASDLVRTTAIKVTIGGIELYSRQLTEGGTSWAASIRSSHV